MGHPCEVVGSNPEPAIMFFGQMCQIALLKVLLYNLNNSKNYGGIPRVSFDIAGEYDLVKVVDAGQTKNAVAPPQL
jgi:hypothetical protein